MLINLLHHSIIAFDLVEAAINSKTPAAPSPPLSFDNETSRGLLGGSANWLEPFGACTVWRKSPHHIFYQITNALFLVGFLAPHCTAGFVWMRAAYFIASVVMLLWGWFMDCNYDTVIWACIFLLVNFFYLALTLVRMRPVKFDKEIEAVYVSLFKPLRVSRQRFRKVLRCMKTIRVLKYQEVFAQEKVTKVDSLSLVLSGKLVVSQNQKALHIVFREQFLDSPEWFGVSTDDYFQVSIVAMEESRVMIWHRDKLKLSIMNDTFLQAVMDHILGRDVVKKLMQVTQVNETLSNGFIISEMDEEDKPMLINHVNQANGCKKIVDGSTGLTALINKQLQASDVNAWRLCRIEEADHETPV